jgi:hypothetical protein
MLDQNMLVYSKCCAGVELVQSKIYKFLSFFDKTKKQHVELCDLNKRTEPNEPNRTIREL